MKKNIGIVTTWFERGAAYVSRQYRDLLKDDYNVFIYARGGEEYATGNPNWDDESVTWGKKAILPIPVAIEKKDFEKWIKKNNIEIILFNEQQWWMPIIWAKESGVICGSYIDYYTEETIPLFQVFDFLICNTKRHLEAFSWHSAVYYIPWGTDVDLFSPNSDEVVCKDGVVFFHSAGMSPERKGTDQLINAFASLKGKKKLIIHSQVELSKKIPKQKGKTVVVDKYFSRADGYYWPQCEVSIKHLNDQMQFYLDNSSKLRTYKENARKVAVENLDWSANKSELVAIFKGLKRANINEYSAILRYEDKKSSSNWIRRLYVKFPFGFRLLSLFYSYF